MLELSEAQLQVRARARAFAERELVPNAGAWDAAHVFPADAVRQLGSLGLLGVALPLEWGGQGADTVSFSLAMEEVARGCAGTAVTMGVAKLYCDAVLKFGDDEQRREFLPAFVRGEKLGCFGLTEPQAGSDASNLQTRAVRDGGDYVLDGSKVYITNAPFSSAGVFFAVTDRSGGHQGITAFLVPMDAPGVAVGRSDDKVGIRASHSAPVFLEGVRIPARFRLGAEGDGFRIAMTALDSGRIGIASQAIGIGQAAFEKAIAFARARPVGQAASFRIADMAVGLDAARLLTWRAAAMKDRGVRFSTQAAMAKLFASELAERVASAALQLHGDAATVAGADVERHWRDSRITQIYEGTSEMQRMVISKALLRPA